jgi:hypothetical protein
MSEIVTLYKCSECGNIITNPNSGVVIHGNIYTAETKDHTILVGNNLPTKNYEGEMTTVSSIPNRIKTTTFCVPCFLNTVLPNAKLTAMR